MKLDKASFREQGLLHGDMALWMIFLSLCMISVVEVYSASSNMTYASGEYWAPVLRHGCFVMLGICFAWVLHMLPCKLYKALSLVIMMLSYILLIWALFTGQKNGAARWIGFGGLTFQPSELAKLGLVTVTAFVFSSFRDAKGVSKFGFNTAAIVICTTLLLIVSENLSTAAIIFLVMYGICFYAQVNTKYLAWIGGGVFGGAILAIALAFAISSNEEMMTSMAKSEGPLHRVPTWVNRITKSHELPEKPADYDITKDIQVTHARIAIGTCGVIGKGPGNSVEREYLPHADNDFIYAIIIEEGGVIAGGIVMFLYLLLLYRAMRIAQRCRSLYPAYLIMGLALMMVTQAMVNMAVASGAMPVTGQPLPLISRGGTSTFVNCAYIGIMLSVSRSARRIDDKPKAVAGIEAPKNEEA